MGTDMIFWYFGFQLGILVCFVILIFKVGEVVSTLHHHFDQVHESQQNTKEILVNMKKYIK